MPFSYEADGPRALQPFLLGCTLMSLVPTDEAEPRSTIPRHRSRAAHDFDVGSSIASKENASCLAIGFGAGGVLRDLLRDVVGDGHQAPLREEDHATEPPHAGQ